MNANELLKRMFGFSDVKLIVNFIKSSDCTQEMIHCDDEYGFSPLIYACQYNKTSIVQALINKGVNVNQLHHSIVGKYSPLELCILYIADEEEELEDKVKIIDLLMKAGVHVANHTLNLACKKNETAIIKKLLDYPIEVEFVDAKGWKPMDYLLLNKNHEMIKLVNTIVLNKKLKHDLPNKEFPTTKSKI